MASTTTSLAYLPLSLEQLVGLIRQLPANEKRQVSEILSEEDETIAVPEAQQQLVMERVHRYDRHPEQLIDEATALKMIEEM